MARIALRPQSERAFAADVRTGLTNELQKQLPSRYLYDTVGSGLFEVITALPEYGVTRAEERIVRSHAAGMASRLPTHALVAELGSGSGRKTRWLLEALCRRHAVTYCPIDISPTALALCRHGLADIAGLRVVGHERDYLDGLRQITSGRKVAAPLLVLFLGSTIGNFRRLAATRFMREVRALLHPGDAFLLGVDLMKPESDLLQAYDDAIGVTAAFNLNLLARINRELGGQFDLRRFAHEARFDAEKRSVDMHLRSLEEQQVEIPGAGIAVRFGRGETIWTESSHKYLAEEVVAMGEIAGFRCDGQWTDRAWPFADTLFGVA
ncbi:MAG: L-histidine N(alpha)-methyltransferase [Casimicrobiaceae bacterium]